MISDEMRELLSAYVDGELRDADAARVEDVSKRDPELRREIEAYRTLRRKLKEWDAAEHGVVPSPSFLGSTLARARTMDAALAAPARVRFLGPLAAAAALLVAASGGYLLARSAPPEAPSLPAAATPVAVKPLGPAPELALPGSALVPAPEPGPALVGSRIDDHIPSRRAVELEEAMRSADLVRAEPPVREPPTGPPMSAEILAMMEGYGATAEPYEALVVLSRMPGMSRLPAVGAAPAAKRSAVEPGEGRIYQDVSGVPHALLAPLGEVWTGVKDGSGRTRVVAASDWVGPAQDVAVVWADEIGVPRTSLKLEVQDYILGPKARQRLLTAKPGRDPGFREWLSHAYGATIAGAFAEGARDRERAVNKLVDVLARDEAATGFAVLDAKGNLLGVEIFHDHALMLAFAQRLLRGYLLEAGDDGIRLAPPRAGDGRLGAVQGLLEGLPARGLRMDRRGLDDSDPMLRIPKGLCRANLADASGRIMGHGLLIDDAPIHLTLFGE
jgi:hypothetical protein